MPTKEKEVMRPCGHRLSENEFKIIRKWARKMKIPEAGTLRFIIKQFDTQN